jgi:hypothetical protein
MCDNSIILIQTLLWYQSIWTYFGFWPLTFHSWDLAFFRCPISQHGNVSWEVRECNNSLITTTHLTLVTNVCFIYFIYHYVVAWQKRRQHKTSRTPYMQLSFPHNGFIDPSIRVLFFQSYNYFYHLNLPQTIALVGIHLSWIAMNPMSLLNLSFLEWCLVKIVGSDHSRLSQSVILVLHKISPSITTPQIFSQQLIQKFNREETISPTTLSSSKFPR